MPPRVPHSPQRMPDSVGLVIERKRLPHEKDGLLWFCERCNHKLYEEFFTLQQHRDGFPVGVRPFLSIARCADVQGVRPRESRAGKVLEAESETFKAPVACVKALPFKGRVGWGWVWSGVSFTYEHHPHPGPPLEGEGEKRSRNGGARPSRMLRNLIQLKPRDVPFRVALRNSAAVVVPLAIGVATGHVGIGLGIAAGALNTMFLDQPGPYRLRMQRMLLTAFAAGVSAFVGSAIGASAPLMTLAALIWGIAGGLLVALGPNAGRAGLTSMILLVVTAATPRPLHEALAAATLIFAGGFLQMLLAIAAWPLQRYRPERHALAALARQLATSARQRADQAQPPPVTEALLDVESLLHGAHRARGEAMETFRVLAGIVERIRRELLAIGDLETTLDAGEARATLARLREYAARALMAFGRRARTRRKSAGGGRSDGRIRIRTRGVGRTAREDHRPPCATQAHDRSCARERPRRPIARRVAQCGFRRQPRRAARRSGAVAIAARAAPAQRACNVARKSHLVVGRVPPRDPLRRLSRNRRRGRTSKRSAARLLDSDDHRDRAQARFRRHFQLRPLARDRHAARPRADHRARALRVRQRMGTPRTARGACASVSAC